MTGISFGRIIGIVFALAMTASPSRAHFGDCGQPASFGPTPLASDALAVLRAAVGSVSCNPCVCDTTADGKVTSSDALRVLRFAVGLGADLSCLICKVEEVIGAAGGTIQSLDGSVKIVIPAGALDSDTTISIEGGSVDELPPSLRGSATVVKLEPAGLTFDVAPALSISRDDAVVLGLGAKIAMLLSVDDDGVEVLGNQIQNVDATFSPTRVTASADLERFSTLAILSLDVSARVTGVPTSVITVNEPLVVTALVTESASEDVVSVVSASFTDDNVGSFHPDNILSTDIPLEEGLAGTFGHGFDYICSSQVSAFYTPEIETVFDFTADFEGAPSGVQHTTFIKANVVCEP